MQYSSLVDGGTNIFSTSFKGVLMAINSVCLDMLFCCRLSIFYLVSLSGSLKEANKDLRAQLVEVCTRACCS